MLSSVKMFAVVTSVVCIAACGGGSNNGTSVYGPDAMYLFDEVEGTIAYNSKFDNFHGEIIGASRVEGKKGNGLDFSVTESAHVLFDICCHADPDTGDGGKLVSFPNANFTIAAWLKPTNMSNGVIYPIFGDSYWGVQSMKMRLNKGLIDFLLYPPNNGAATPLIISSFALTNDEWVHVAVTFNGSQAVIYINGEEDSYSDIVMPVEDIVNDYYIGGIPGDHPGGDNTQIYGEHSFPGIIDAFFMSENALSKIEVQQLILETE